MSNELVPLEQHRHKIAGLSAFLNLVIRELGRIRYLHLLSYGTKKYNVKLRDSPLLGCPSRLTGWVAMGRNYLSFSARSFAFGNSTLISLSRYSTVMEVL